jgi:hypothetical protein
MSRQDDQVCPLAQSQRYETGAMIRGTSGHRAHSNPMQTAIAQSGAHLPDVCVGAGGQSVGKLASERQIFLGEEHLRSDGIAG